MCLSGDDVSGQTQERGDLGINPRLWAGNNFLTPILNNGSFEARKVRAIGGLRFETPKSARPAAGLRLVGS